MRLNLLSDRVHGEVIHNFSLDCPPPKGTHQGSATILFNKKTGAPFVGKPKASAGARTMRFYQYVLKFYRPRDPFCPPLGLSIAWIHRVPKSLAKELRESGEEYLFHSKIPDNTNVAKIIEDAMTRTGFWKDDSHISDHKLTKRYAFRPRVEVSIFRPELS